MVLFFYFSIVGVNYMLTFISDLHYKSTQPYKKSIDKFMEEVVIPKYKDVPLIFLGDEIDSGSPKYELVHHFISYLQNFKEVYLLKGNHTNHYHNGSLQFVYAHLSNVVVIDEQTTLEIDGKKVLFLPYTKNPEEDYSNISQEEHFDICCYHLHSLQSDEFGEKIDLSYINADLFIEGHSHNHKIYEDSKKRDVVIPGVILPSRHGEKYGNIVEIEGKTSEYKLIEVPKYFEYENVEYPNLPSHKDNIINVLNAPSIESVYDTYKDCYIRDTGITIKYGEEEVEEDSEYMNNDLKKEFSTYCELEKKPKSILNKGLKYLSTQE
jgi:predicted phosphodiesterase